MSSEWPLKELVHIADEVTVGYVGPMASEYVESGIPFLRSLNIEPFGINRNDLKFVTPEFHRRIKKSSLQPGDVAIVRTGKPGTCAVIPDWLKDANCSDLVIVRCGKEIRPRFLCYWVNSVASHHIDSHTVGAVQQHFNVGAAKTMKVAVPSLPKQDQVVKLLGALDDRITLLRETNATLEAIAQALFKSWFVDFDPAHAKQQGRAPEGMDEATAALFPDSFAESKLGLIPKGWSVNHIDEVAEKVGMGPFGSNIKVSTFVSQGVPVLNGRNVQDTLLTDLDFNFITPSHAEKLKNSCVNAGDVVFTHRGTLGQVALVPEGLRYDQFVVSQSQFFLRCNRRRMVPEWITYFFKSPIGQQLLLANTSQVGVPSIARPVSHLRSIKLVLPPFEILSRFSETVSSLHKSVVANRQQAQTLATLRDTLLPRLISGQLRLPEAEATL